MSDTSQGSDWWLASDGKWYAPELHPNYVPPPPLPPPPQATTPMSALPPDPNRFSVPTSGLTGGPGPIFRNDSAVLVDARNAARTLPVLGMRCSAKEIPEPISGSAPLGWWIAAEAMFSGVAFTDWQSEPPSNPRTLKVLNGTMAVAVADGRLLGIFSTNSLAQPAIWFAPPITGMKLELEGSQGVFKKSPKGIIFTTEHSEFAVLRVSKLWRGRSGNPKDDRLQPGQMASFVEALGVG